MTAVETLELPPAPSTEAAPPRSLLPSRFQQAEHARTVWRVVAEEGTTIEDVLKPQFWAHVAHTMARFDRIEVLADDETWFLDLIIRDCGRGFAKVAILAKTEFEASVEKATSIEGFEIAWKGPKRRWSVIREEGRAPIKDNFPGKAQALAWVQEFVQAGGA